MPKIKSAVLKVLAVTFLGSALVAQTPTTNLDSCGDDLDGLRRTAADASEAAQDARSKREDYEECKLDPQTFDFLGDNCHGRGSDYESAMDELETKMDDLNTKLRSIQGSCDYQFTMGAATSLEHSRRRMESAQRRLCASYLRLTQMGVTRESVLQTCKSNSSEQWCRECLGVR